MEPGSLNPSAMMHAIRLHSAAGAEGLEYEEIESPRPGEGQALVRVYAAAITRDELAWSVDRLPAIPSYEFSGMVVELGPGAAEPSIDDEVFGLAGFDRDGAAADFVSVPAGVLAPKPGTLGHTESAALPLAALSAWQGLFDHGHLEAGNRVLISGAAGGVGHLATQLARGRGAYVIGTASPEKLESVRTLGAHETLDRTEMRFENSIEPVDLVFDTVGGELLRRSPGVVRPGGRIVSIAEDPPELTDKVHIDCVYFVVEPNRDQLIDIARLVDRGALKPAIDSVFPLAEAHAAFARSMESGTRGKVILRVIDD
jgi:NADPH:quinone reductase-like Zn-dependent oxidoreductase